MLPPNDAGGSPPRPTRVVSQGLPMMSTPEGSATPRSSCWPRDGEGRAGKPHKTIAIASLIGRASDRVGGHSSTPADAVQVAQRVERKGRFHVASIDARGHRGRSDGARGPGERFGSGGGWEGRRI